MANIDPLSSLLDFIAANKPYHTKVFESTMVYTYEEPVNTTVLENFQINIGMYTIGDTDPQGYVYGGGAYPICPGVGWDTNPFDTDMWDYPYICGSQDPRLVAVTITENFQVDIGLLPTDHAMVFAHDDDNGWDIDRWDVTPWDLDLGLQTIEQDNADDSGATTLAESFFIVAYDNGSTTPSTSQTLTTT